MPDVTNPTALRYVDTVVRPLSTQIVPVVRHCSNILEAWRAYGLTQILGVDQADLDAPPDDPPDPTKWPLDPITGPTPTVDGRNVMTVREACMMYRAALYITRLAADQRFTELFLRFADLPRV